MRRRRKRMRRMRSKEEVSAACFPLPSCRRDATRCPRPAPRLDRRFLSQRYESRRHDGPRATVGAAPVDDRAPVGKERERAVERQVADT
ncbi:Protein of unknown function [Gryllus bimaculatus]|nr:Protein of unknown function [Gryllus bimaculatus]